MKSIGLFVVILFIGAFGGIIAAEVKPMLSSSSSESSASNNELDSDTMMKALDNKYGARIKALEKANKEKDIIINDLNNKIEEKDEELSESEGTVVSKNEEINNLQGQINELRGIVKAMQQNLPKMVASNYEKEKEEEDARREAEQQERIKQAQEQMKQRQTEMINSHTDRMAKELGLSESQSISIKEALNQSSEKMMELFSNRENWGDRDAMRQKTEAIQKEWEETAKSVLTPQQYEQFIEKNLNRVNPMGGGRFNRGDRGGRSSGGTNNQPGR